jgi:Fe-S-cluster containining protein
MDELCQNCGGKCCVGEIEVLSKDAIFSDDSLTTKVEANGFRDRVIKTDPQNNCIALVGGKCTIYDKRPWVCRKFEVDSVCCSNFITGKNTRHECEICNLFLTGI